MNTKTIDVYGIGNPLIDILIQIQDSDLKQLGIDKGIMQLIDFDQRRTILRYFKSAFKTFGCGGSCPNTVISAAAFGLKGTLAGRVADDEFGEIYTEQLTSLNVDDKLSSGEGATGSSIILITPDTERSMNTYLGVNRDFTRDDIHPELIAASRYLYFTGYMWDTEVQKDAISAAIEIAHAAGTKVVFDVADPFAVGRYKQDFRRLIKENVEVVLANQEEACLLFDTADIHACIREMAEHTEMAILKHGPTGSCIFTEATGVIDVPANKVKAVDTTGAGDMYASGVLYGLCKDFSVEKTGRCASWLASQIVTRIGAQFDVREIPEIQEQLKRIDAVFPG